MIKHVPDVAVVVTVEVMRTMLSAVTQREDELNKLPFNVLVPTTDPANT